MALKDTGKKEFHTSVRNLVEFIFREGDIDNRKGKLQSAEAMLEGSRIHRKIQSEQRGDYAAEVPLSVTLDEGAYNLVVEGRADGIFSEEEDGVLHTYIDEIKGMYANILVLEEPLYVHKAQAMCYAYIYAAQHGLDAIGVQMTYCDLEDGQRKLFREVMEYDDLHRWFDDLICSYKRWLDFQYEWRLVRQASIASLEFPFAYRKGQKKLVGDVYRTIARQKILFIQAPTGVGKTVSTIFPAVKAVGEELGDRIFYLTAKTVTATVAKETFALLAEHGYQAKSIQITAKEKLCMCGEMDCNPVHCPYAKGHYDRVNDAVFDLLQKSDFFTREEILAQAEEYRVCPFEMSLDVATWADNIVCDYNYVFDPNVYLKRFFQEGAKGDYLFLVDEAHNLVERSREMYSAALCKEDFLQVKRLLAPHSKKIAKDLERCNKILLEMKRGCVGYAVHEDVKELMFPLARLGADMDEFLQKPMEFPGHDVVLDFYFGVRNFLNIYDLLDEHYVIYSEISGEKRFTVKLFCVDPSKNLQACLDKARSTVFFSATLLPIHYYKSLLSTNGDNYAIYAETAFSPAQRLLLFGKNVSTKYTRRSAEEFERIALYIARTVRCKKGNYMVFFPSYKLMEQVQEPLARCLEECGGDGVRLICQKNGMREQEREAFLGEFSGENEETLVALCVMGGIFAEGIDLKNDRLIGAIVVGTGLPQVSNERDILKNYYDGRNGNGFDYAFRYPGMNKVLQAAGRVIRTTEDRGIILLLDERFLNRDYEGLYPREWADRKVVDVSGIEEEISHFWANVTL